MSHPGSISNVGGGKVHGLCILAGCLHRERTLQHYAPFFTVYLFLHSPQPVVYEQLFKMLPSLPLVTSLLPLVA